MSTLVNDLATRPDISKPRWDQSKFVNRAKHFFSIINPIYLLVSDKDLEAKHKLVVDYKNGVVPANLTLDELWRAKNIVDSSYHPQTGKKMFILGRMSSQMPCNTVITGGMLTFYKSAPSVIFWQWINQTYNAVVNFTNQSGDNAVSKSQILKAYCGATGGALSVALGLNALAKKMPPVYARLVPFCAVALANAVNIPMMRSKELTTGIELFDANGNLVGNSTKVAKQAIAQVIVSRVAMAVPHMVLTPILINRLSKTEMFKRRPWIGGPLQTAMAGFLLLYMTPLACALFEQRTAYKTANLEPEVRKQIEAYPSPPEIVYFNKGL